MAHFIGAMKSKRGIPVTRLGHKTTGMRVIAASWKGAIEVNLWDDENGVDRYAVDAVEWMGSGEAFPIARGVVGKRGQK